MNGFQADLVEHDLDGDAADRHVTADASGGDGGRTVHAADAASTGGGISLSDGTAKGDGSKLILSNGTADGGRRSKRLSDGSSLLLSDGTTDGGAGGAGGGGRTSKRSSRGSDGTSLLSSSKSSMRSGRSTDERRGSRNRGTDERRGSHDVDAEDDYMSMTATAQELIRRFTKERNAEKAKQYYQVVLYGGWICGGACVILLSAGVIGRWSLLGSILRLFGVATMVVGVLVLSTCPTDELDLDALMRSKKGEASALKVPGLAAVLLSLFLGFNYPPFWPHALAIFPLLGIICGGKQVHVFQQPRATTLVVVWYVVLIMAGSVGYYHMATRLPSTAKELRPLYLWLSGYMLLGSLFLAWIWWEARRRHVASLRRIDPARVKYSDNNSRPKSEVELPRPGPAPERLVSIPDGSRDENDDGSSLISSNGTAEGGRGPKRGDGDDNGSGHGGAPVRDPNGSPDTGPDSRVQPTTPSSSGSAAFGGWATRTSSAGSAVAPGTAPHQHRPSLTNPKSTLKGSSGSSAASTSPTMSSRYDESTDEVEVIRSHTLHHADEMGLMAPEGANPTLALYLVMYGALFLSSVEKLIEGGWFLYLAEACRTGVHECDSRDRGKVVFYPTVANGVIELVYGVINMTGPILVMLMGRRHIFHLCARYFDAQQSIKDGAFIAALLDKSIGGVEEGDVWWVHREKENLRFFKNDRRRNFQPGRVVAIRDTEFAVELTPEGPQRAESSAGGIDGAEQGIDSVSGSGTSDDVGSTSDHSSSGDGSGGDGSPARNRATSAGLAGEVTQKLGNVIKKKIKLPPILGSGNKPSKSDAISSRHHLSSAHDPMSTSGLSMSGMMSGRALESYRDLRRVFTSRSSKSSLWNGVGKVVWVPHPSRNMPSNQLLMIARQNLRCIDADKITLELLTRVPPDPDKEVDYHAMSRPVRPGEAIDFFMSHSWYDDEKLKYQQIQTLVESFERRHGRKPTFWLDKVCIDQDNITDGLKVLPINVMACKKMLVLCGPTYPTRLWCAWELCTLFSFMRQQQALARVVLLPLNKDPESDVSYSLLKFDVKEARCYDPNEEMGLRKVIEGVGLERFNTRIHALAHAFQEQMDRDSEQRRKSRRLSSFSFMTGSTRQGFKSQSGLGLAVARITHNFRRLKSAQSGPARTDSSVDGAQNAGVEEGSGRAAAESGGSSRSGSRSDRKNAWENGQDADGGSAELLESGGSPALTSRISIGIINRQVTEAPPGGERLNEVSEEKATVDAYDEPGSLGV